VEAKKVGTMAETRLRGAVAKARFLQSLGMTAFLPTISSHEPGNHLREPGREVGLFQRREAREWKVPVGTTGS
jgi:hypothetical protein